jgi:transcription termination factor Rho
MAEITIEQIIDLAFNVEQGDPIDWSVFKEGKEQTLKMIASSVIEQFQKEQYTEDDLLIMMASITKLATENMILHTKLLQLKEKDA